MADFRRVISNDKSLGLLLVGCPQSTSPGRCPGDPNQLPKPPYLAPFDMYKQQLFSESLLDDQAFHPISQGEPRHPVEETHFSFYVLSVTTQSFTLQHLYCF